MYLNYTLAMLGLEDGVTSGTHGMPRVIQPSLDYLQFISVPLDPSIVQDHATKNSGVKNLHFLARPPRWISRAMIGFLGNEQGTHCEHFLKQPSRELT